MAKIQGSASQHLTLHEENEAKTTGALDRLRICLELCMKAACGQDLGLLDGDPLTHSPAVKCVVELWNSLQRRIKGNDILKVELKERSSAADVWKAELQFLNKLLGDCRKITFGRPTEDTKDIPPWMDKEMYLGIVENVRQLKDNFDEASKGKAGDDLKADFAQILRVALGEEKIPADLLAVASTTLLTVQGLREKVDEIPDRETAQYRETVRLHMKNKIDALKEHLGQCRRERDFLDDLIFTFNKVRTNQRIKKLDEVPPGIDPKYIELGQRIIALAYKFREQSEELILCRKIAMGEAEHLDVRKGSAAEAVQQLRDRMDGQPETPRPVPSRPPGPGEVSADMELSAVRDMRKDFPKVSLIWELWRVGHEQDDRTFYIARCREDHSGAFVYWPMGDIMCARFYDKQTRGAELITLKISADDELFLDSKMKYWGINT